MDSAREELRRLRARCRRLDQLHRVTRVIHSTLDSREALGLLVREAARLMRAASGSVALLNPTNGFLETEAEYGLAPGAAALNLRLGEGISGWVALTAKPARVGNAPADARCIPARPGVRSELAVPLADEGEVRGVLKVDSDQAEAFDAEDQQLLEELAKEAVRVIRNTWRHEQSRLKARLFESLVQVSQAVNSALDSSEAFEAVASQACKLMDARLCSLLLLDESREWLVLRACHGGGQACIARPRLSMSESLLGTVVRHKRPVQVENVQVAGRYHGVEVARREGLVSLLSVPLLLGGEAIGALNVYTGQPHRFSNEEIRVLGALAELSAVALGKARLHEQVADLEEQLRRNERLSALGLLAAEVAHEIRNPLAVMKLLFQSLDLDFPPEDPRARDARLIGEKIEQLNRIVEHVLDLARNNAPAFRLLDPRQLIDELALLIRHKLSHQKVRLERKLAKGAPAIMADPALLAQAFLNLALNAVQAMPDGGRLAISTRLVRHPRSSLEPTYLEVSFRDTGQGMDQAQRKRVLEPLLASTKPRGTGLGLALVARIAESHRGKLLIQSRAGRGTTVALLLPLSASSRDGDSPVKA